MANSIVYEIEKLLEELPLVPEGKKFREFKKIKLHDDSENICLSCHRRTYTRGEKYGPYGGYRTEAMLHHIYMYLEHLKVFTYKNTEKKVFIDSVTESEILKEKDNRKDWYFDYDNITGIFILKRIEGYNCVWDDEDNGWDGE